MIPLSTEEKDVYKRQVFRLAGELCLEKGVRYMRADTDYPNERMQHVLKKNGFVLCGEIFYQGGGRLAYDKML